MYLTLTYLCLAVLCRVTFPLSLSLLPQMSLHSKPLTLQIGQGHTLTQTQGRLPRTTSNFSLSQVDVETELDDDNETGSEMSSRPATTPKAGRSNRSLKYEPLVPPVPSETSRMHNVCLSVSVMACARLALLRYKLTPEGYKSFHGGWIEGLSEDQHVYYYNTVTGESSWHLPEELGGLPEENSQEIAAEMDSVEQFSHYEHPHLQQPTHHFTDMYAPHDAAAETEAAQQYGGQSHDQGYEGYPDPSADPQQQPQGGYYDEQGGYYDEHGEESPPPLPDPNRVVTRCDVVWCGCVYVCQATTTTTNMTARTESRQRAATRTRRRIPRSRSTTTRSRARCPFRCAGKWPTTPRRKASTCRRTF